MYHKKVFSINLHRFYPQKINLRAMKIQSSAPTDGSKTHNCNFSLFWWHNWKQVWWYANYGRAVKINKNINTKQMLSQTVVASVCLHYARQERRKLETRETQIPWWSTLISRSFVEALRSKLHLLLCKCVNINMTKVQENMMIFTLQFYS